MSFLEAQIVGLDALSVQVSFGEKSFASNFFKFVRSFYEASPVIFTVIRRVVCTIIFPSRDRSVDIYRQLGKIIAHFR